MRLVIALSMLMAITCSVAACSNNGASVLQQEFPRVAEKMGVRPLGVATCDTCVIYRNGGNGIATGTMNWSQTMTFYTTIVLYDSNWAPRSYNMFAWNNPTGWFWQGLPSGATQDVIAGEIDWGFYCGGVWWTSGASLQILN